MKDKLIKINLALAVLILVLVPFHAPISIFAYSVIGHYTLTRLFEEYILLIMLGIGLYLLFSDFKSQKKLFKSSLIIVILVYLLLQIIYALLFHHYGQINTKAMFYGLLLNTRYLIFFLLTYQAVILAKANKISIKTNLFKIVLIPALVVVLFGLLQIFILPRDFLSHFGYGPKTIMPFETVNHNLNYIRIMSTLRGANPLGAYLLIPIAAISLLIVRGKFTYKRGLSLFATLIVLFYSYSRSAYLGSIVTVLSVIFFSLNNPKLKKRLLIGLSCLVLIFIAIGITFKDNTHFQNIVFHTQKNSLVKTTSDQGHQSALKSGLSDIANNPLGHGPGSAGPASVYNSHPARISENYFLQIGQESGIFGLVLFLAIISLSLIKLFKNRKDNLSLILMSSMFGIIIVSMLSFALSDETLAFLWWGLLGFALGGYKLTKTYLGS